MPLKPCLGVYGHPCNRLTPNRRCPDCQTVLAQRQESARPSWVERYGPDWRTVSRQVIAANPVCVICAQEGHHDPDTGERNPLTAGHIVSRRCGGSNDRENLQTECRRCNSSKRCECPNHPWSPR